MLPLQRFLEVEHCKKGENHEGDDLLNEFQLKAAKAARIAGPIRWNHDEVFQEGNAPANENGLPQRPAFLLEVEVPGNGHEDVAEGEQTNCDKNGAHSEEN